MLVGGKEFLDDSSGYLDAAEHVEKMGYVSEAYDLRREAWDRAPLWSRIAHWLGRCLRCETYSVDEGIGGRCIDCGKIHGWVTRQELHAYADKHIPR